MGNMNTFKKYTSGVFCMQSTEDYIHGQETTILTKYNKEVPVMIYKFLKAANGFKYYSIVRLDGKNSKAHYLKLADKREAQAERAEQKSNEYYAKSNKDRDFLSLAEPIKVGHHSERRHRKIIDQAYNNMGKSVAESEKAAALEYKAESLASIAENLFIDTPEGLQGLIDKVAELEQQKADLKAGGDYKSFQLTNLGANIRRYKERLQTAKELWDLNHDNSAPTKKQVEAKTKQEKQAAMNKLLAENGVIWAFSNKQFDESKVEGVQYVSIGAGGYCPKDNVENFMQAFKQF
jgi:hypothetical protein